MRIKLKPRFFLIFGIFIFGVILFSSNFFFKKRVEVKLVNSEANEVLAAEDSTLFGNSKTNNNLENSNLKTNSSPNAASNISEYQPVTISYTVKEGDTLQSIAEKYHADAQTIADFPNNNLKESLQLKVGQILIIPNGYIDEKFAPAPPPVAQGSGQFSWPVMGQITQYAYYWHPGAIDIAVDMLTSVKAADNGKVIHVNHFTTGYGVHVIIDHGGELTSLYAHLTEVRVVEGQMVRKGDLIGLSGSTGHSTGPHLHFEVRRGNTPIDPMTLLPPVN